MTRVITAKEEFEEKVKKETKPRFILFYDNESSRNRVRAYENLIINQYPSVLSYKVNCDDIAMSKEDAKKYISAPLICCTAICKDSIRCASNPGDELRELMDWLLECKIEN